MPLSEHDVSLAIHVPRLRLVVSQAQSRSDHGHVPKWTRLTISSQSLEGQPQLALPRTKWVDECCATLAENPVYPTDVLLRTWIQCESLIKKVNIMFGYDEPFSFDFSNEVLLNMAVKTLEAEVAKIKDDFKRHSDIAPCK